MKTAAIVTAAMLALSGCATSGLGSSGGSTSASAGATAAQVGSRTINAMGGGLIGGSIGQGLGESDRRSALVAEYRALEYTPNGQKVTWKSESSAVFGEVVAAQPYRVGSQDCRQYSHTVFGGSQPAMARGTACRNADGSWTPLS